jgi:hypothetical protein
MGSADDDPLDASHSLPTVVLPAGPPLTCTKQHAAFVSSAFRHVVITTPEEEAEQFGKDWRSIHGSSIRGLAAVGRKQLTDFKVIQPRCVHSTYNQKYNTLSKNTPSIYHI